MGAYAQHLAAMVNSYAEGDDESFYLLARQVAAREARSGNKEGAREIKTAIAKAEQSRQGIPNLSILPTSVPGISGLADYSEPQHRLTELVVSTQLRASISNFLEEQRHRDTLESFGFTPAHRLLLAGPPGTGKTLTASVIAGELHLPLMVIRVDALVSKYLGETASKLREVFDYANTHPGVYFFDEFDAIGADRGLDDIGEARRIVNTFLILLESVSPRAIVLAATNHKMLLDRALFRRFDDVLTYELPTADQAMEVVRKRLGSMVTKSIASKAAVHALGLSHADIINASEAAAKAAILQGSRRVSEDELMHQLKNRRYSR